MKRFRLFILVTVAAVFAALVYYFYGGSTPPAGQSQLVRVTPANFAGLREAFNAGSDRVRVIVMLSPT